MIIDIKEIFQYQNIVIVILLSICKVCELKILNISNKSNQFQCLLYCYNQFTDIVTTVIFQMIIIVDGNYQYCPSLLAIMRLLKLQALQALCKEGYVLRQGRTQNLMWVGSFQEKVDLFDGAGVAKHAKARGVWGHAPPGKF